MMASLADLGLNNERSVRSHDKQTTKQQIPLHETLPPEEFVKKAAPVPFDELKFINTINSGVYSLHGRMATKNQQLLHR